jgi:flavin reductase (DIM6/NTAB) family NADH-FMN oxidoreductase RutF
LGELWQAFYLILPYSILSVMASATPVFRTWNPAELPTGELHQLLLGSVAPRPIALASTVDREGNANLAPFSYFNVFSTHPPLVIFAPNRSGRTGAQKDTLLNLMEVPEVVVNLVDYAMVEQVNLSSAEYPRGVNEFAKAGLTALPGTRVQPARVAESPAQLECTVREIITLGARGGSGNLVLAEVVAIHIDAARLTEKGVPDPQLMDLVARMGANYYCRASGASVFEVEKPIGRSAIGWDGLPTSVRESTVFTGNDLGKLANTDTLPSPAEVDAFRQTAEWQQLKSLSPTDLHRLVQTDWSTRPLHDRWLLLLAGG